MLWDVFCKVIDNHGDIGVCWRLASQLAVRGERVRLWVDDPSALAWMAPRGQAGVEVVHWTPAAPVPVPGDVVVEAFGCELDGAFIAAIAARTARDGRQPVWINLEYLTAESYAARSHGLPSPVMAGPGKGLVKRFFYPGFTAGTGGLLREPDLVQRQDAFDRDGWLRGHGIEPAGERLVSLFCYEPPALQALLQQLAQGPQPTRLLVTAGRAAAAVQERIGLQPAWGAGGVLSISYLPLLQQDDFDHLLWACDFNLVRGEDSLVRALWARKPFAWQLYPQDDGAHHAKLQAFLGWLQAPPSLVQFHAAWNGTHAVPLPPPDLPAWAACAMQAAQAAASQDSLCTQLVAFAAGESGPRPAGSKTR